MTGNSLGDRSHLDLLWLLCLPGTFNTFCIGQLLILINIDPCFRLVLFSTTEPVGYRKSFAFSTIAQSSGDLDFLAFIECSSTHLFVFVRNGTSLLMKDPFWNGTQNGTQHYPAKPYIELPRWTDCSDR